MTERSGDLSGKQDTLFNNYQSLSGPVCQSSGVRKQQREEFLSTDFVPGKTEAISNQAGRF